MFSIYLFFREFLFPYQLKTSLDFSPLYHTMSGIFYVYFEVRPLKNPHFSDLYTT